MNNYKFSDICIGLEQSFNKKITSDMMNKFLEISDDINPLHLDTEYARKAGFPERIVYGLLSSSFYSTLVGVYLPGKYCILQGIDIHFLKPIFINDDLTIAGKVNYINEAYKQIEIKAFMLNQKKIKVSRATIKVGIKDE